MFLRVRLGNFRIGLRIERLPHSMIIRFLFSKVADTAGVLNKFANTNQQCLFMDFDDRANYSAIYARVMHMQQIYNVGDVLLFKSSENHYIGVSFDLLTPDEIKECMNYLSPIMDYRFTYVYSRDGYNAIRVTPKVVDNRIYRPMKLVDIIMSPNNIRIKHKGLIQVFDEIFPLPTYFFDEYRDDSSKEDVYERRYETINW